MFVPVKNSAESRSCPEPAVVALDAAMYRVPGLLPSNALFPGSPITLSMAFLGYLAWCNKACSLHIDLGICEVVCQCLVILPHVGICLAVGVSVVTSSNTCFHFLTPSSSGKGFI